MADMHMEGVYIANKKNGETYYRSSITYRGKHISLGSYNDQTTAHLAYKTAWDIISPESSLILEDYYTDSPLSFEKWVILMNFRDNHMYLSTPIYVRPKFFYYYLSPERVLKFDTDDLFYYSSHKIMCRGNHYFVADYGMQQTITARYGIKNYAVPGVDFEFLNGDPTDFRRENITVFNHYHGVRMVTENNTTRYAVRIHINGYYQVGEYPTIIEAAIAYNKAVDVLHQNGLHKNYAINYVEGISPKVYADIYSALTISPKLYELKP